MCDKLSFNIRHVKICINNKYVQNSIFIILFCYFPVISTEKHHYQHQIYLYVIPTVYYDVGYAR